jgi:hypothetical protein
MLLKKSLMTPKRLLKKSLMMKLERKTKKRLQEQRVTAGRESTPEVLASSPTPAPLVRPRKESLASLLANQDTRESLTIVTLTLAPPTGKTSVSSVSSLNLTPEKWVMLPGRNWLARR